MKGSSEVITQLNEVLKGEVTAVNQYFLHASMCKNWGYLRLYKKIYEESLEEMRHAQQLIDRLLFLEGMPVLTQPLAVHVGQDLKDLLERDRQLESSTLPPLQQGVTLCLEQGDTGTPELLEHLIVESEEHHGRRPRELRCPADSARGMTSDTPYLLPPPLPRAAICMAARAYLGREAHRSRTASHEPRAHHE